MSNRGNYIHSKLGNLYRWSWSDLHLKQVAWKCGNRGRLLAHTGSTTNKAQQARVPWTQLTAKCRPYRTVFSFCSWGMENSFINQTNKTRHLNWIKQKKRAKPNPKPFYHTVAGNTPFSSETELLLLELWKTGTGERALANQWQVEAVFLSTSQCTRNLEGKASLKPLLYCYSVTFFFAM